MPQSPYLVELISPENAPATIILPNGQHYTRELDATTGGLATKITCWDHDVDAMKAAGFRDPEELAAAQAVHATIPAQPEQEPEPGPEQKEASPSQSAPAAAPTTATATATDEVAPEPQPQPEPQPEQNRGRGGGRRGSGDRGQATGDS